MNALLPAALHAALSAAVLLAVPRAERTARWVAVVAWVSACVGTAHLVDGAVVAGAAWALSIAPFLLPGVLERRLGAADAAGLALFPAQTALANAFERGPLLPLTLLASGHLGALTAHRVLAFLPAAEPWRPWLVAAALLWAGVCAVFAYGETRPRRVLARLLAAQGALYLAGLLAASPAGAAGASALWQTAAVSTVMLALIYSGLEARVGAATLERPGFLGLAQAAPRLAVFFAVAAFALGDLPFTLGFAAAELLQRGLFGVTPVGLALPAVAGLNAFVAVRLFARLFWGRPAEAAAAASDALPRERVALGAGLLYLLVGGMLPSLLLP